MDPVIYKQIVAYKTSGTYPVGLTKVERNTFRKKAHTYDIEDGELYYSRRKGSSFTLKTKVVCGAEEANSIFKDFHASSTGAHCGQRKTRDAISRRFYWPGMSSDIDTWVVKQPFELIGMDLIGKLSLTDSGNQYICVIVDYVTKWPQAYPIKNKSAIEVTDCLLKFVHQFETPKRVLTDQGKEFVNELNKHVCEVLDIKRSLCSPYHPQTNGLVERMNGVIQRALSKLVNKKPKEWDKHLDAVMFGLRTKKQMTTKYSPFFLMFGREARYPSEVPEHYRIDSTVEETVACEEITESALRLNDILTQAKANIEKTQEKMKKSKQKSPLPKFSVGDRVWRLNVRSQQRKGGKLEPNYLGPYKITSVEGKSADLEDDRGIIIPKINTDHLRHHREETPRIPHKLQNRSEGNEKSTSTEAPAILAPADPTYSTTPRVSTVIVSPTVSPVTVKPTVSTVIVSPTVSPITKPPTVATFTKTPALASSNKTPALASFTKTPALASSNKTPALASFTKTPALASSNKTAFASCTVTPAVSLAPTKAAALSADDVSTPASEYNIDKDQCLREAWQGKDVYVLLAKIGPYKIFFADIHRTAPNMEFESEVMNAYMCLIVQDYNRQSPDKVVALDTFEMSNIWNHKRAKVKLDPLMYKYVIGIINQNHHWTLMVVIPSEKRVLYLDPLGESSKNLKRCQEVARSFMRQRGLNVSRWACNTVPHPHQKDSSSCGPFVLKFAECILKDKPISFSTKLKDVEDLRKEIAIALLQRTDALSDLCHFCGEVQNAQEDTDWIGCELCPRWFHYSCVKKPAGDTDYICDACRTD